MPPLLTLCKSKKAKQSKVCQTKSQKAAGSGERAGIEAQRNKEKNWEESEELNILLKEQEVLFQERAKTRMFKFMQQEYMQQEKCSAYLFAQMKKKEEKGAIMELEREGKSVTGRDNILKMVEEYYSSLFGVEEVDRGAQEMVLGFLKERLPEDARKLLERSITNHELYEAIKTMKNNKVPGIDGLTKEFYITFWDLIGDHLLEVFEEMCETGRMPKSMRTGVISLLHKKGSPAVLSNYRPLSMVCVDYKILSRTLARRLARVLPAIINADQTCGVKGRQIGWNLQLHRDVLTYIEERNLTTICVTLDQEKAFDRVNHDFLWRVN